MNGRAERFTTPDLSGVTLNTVHWGDPGRPALVLLHGGGANCHWWDHLALDLAERFRVIALDFRGHGDSDYPIPLEAGAFRKDLEALIQHFEIRDVTLIGHSMGAHVALDCAALSDDVYALAAIEPSRGANQEVRRRARLALAARRSYRRREDAVRRYRFLPLAPGVSESLRRAIAEHSVRQESDGRFGFKFDPRWFSQHLESPPPFSNIRCRCLILRGEESALLSREGAEEIASEIPHSELIEIPHSGHNAHLEQPAAVLRAIRQHLDPNQ